MLHQVGIEILITNLIGIDLNLPEGYQFMERILHTHNKLLFWRIKYFTKSSLINMTLTQTTGITQTHSAIHGEKIIAHFCHSSPSKPRTHLHHVSYLMMNTPVSCHFRTYRCLHSAICTLKSYTVTIAKHKIVKVDTRQNTLLWYTIIFRGTREIVLYLHYLVIILSQFLAFAISQLF